MKGDFVKQGRGEMRDFVLKAIDDLLNVLDSAVEFPYDKEGRVVYSKLFPIVQAREQVWISCTELMDMANIDKTSNKTYLNKITKGFETTWHEMTKIVCMDIGEYVPSMDKLLGYKQLSEENIKQLARESVTDDRLSSISKAKVLAAKLSYQILDRIEKMNNPEAIQVEELNNAQTSSVIEKYAEN